MNRIRLLTLSTCLAFAGLVIGTAPESASAADDGKKWVTIKGQVKWPEKEPIPKPVKIDTKDEKKHCESKGELFTDNLVINPKNKGLKNIMVYLRPNNKEADAKFDPKEIPEALQKPKAVTHEADQPCCAFIPKVMTIRSGDFVKFKNSSPVNHNVNLSADLPSPSFNKTVAPGGFYLDPLPFVAQNSPITYSCSIHPWMNARFMVFDHPFHAVTDDDGKFEIKNAPAGKYRIVYRGEGYHKGKEGRYGWEIDIKGNDKNTMDLETLEFVIPPG